MEDRQFKEEALEKRYRVTLTVEERDELRGMVSGGQANARQLVRASVLLLADQADGGSAKSDTEIVDTLGCGRATVDRVRRQFVEEGLEDVLEPSPSTRIYGRKLDGKEAGRFSHPDESLWCGFVCGVSFEGWGEEVEGVAFVWAAGFEDGRERFHEAAAGSETTAPAKDRPNHATGTTAARVRRTAKRGAVVIWWSPFLVPLSVWLRASFWCRLAPPCGSAE